MVRTYWKGVAKRAWRRSLEIVRLESGERVFVFLIGLLVPAIAVWFFVGDSVAVEVRALASIGASAVAVLVVFGWSLLKLPAVMESEAEQERERLAAQLETQERKKRILDDLGRFMMTGAQWKRAMSDLDNEPPYEQANQWLAELHAYLGESLGVAYVARVDEAAAMPMGMTSLTGERAGYDSGMRVRLFNLEQFCRELA